MKKLGLLILILFATSIAFSQTGTNNTTSKDTSIVLPKNVAREVVKDLLRYDSVAGEITLVKNNYEKLQSNLILKDSIINSKVQIISLFKEKEEGYKAIMGFKDNQIKTLDDLSKQLNKDLKKEKAKRIFSNVFSSVLIGGLIYGLIMK